MGYYNNFLEGSVEGILDLSKSWKKIAIVPVCNVEEMLKGGAKKCTECFTAKSAISRRGRPFSSYRLDKLINPDHNGCGWNGNGRDTAQHDIP